MMLFLIKKQGKAGVRDLNSLERALLFAPDEFRPIQLKCNGLILLKIR